ncbi:MAG: NAD-dependent epimerase/dehydratase family protein [Thermoproteota archaeon]
MKILVTGASGFLGGHLVEEMSFRNYNVIGMVRKSSDTSFLRSLDVELRVGDLTVPESLSQVTEKIDIVIHLAAYYTFFGKKRNVQEGYCRRHETPLRIIIK